MRLTREESEILKDFEEGRLVPSVTDEKILQRFADGAERAGEMRRKIDIRLTENDFQTVQIMAEEKGIPCQMLISSIIHEYVSGRKPSLQ